MKKACLLILLAVLLLLVLPISAQADEAAKYNFASAQGDKELRIPPGEEGTGYIYFYNIDGNRITHITLEVGQAPSGWEITIEPPIAETEVLVSGVPVAVEENLYVEPSELLTEEPQDIPEGMVSIKVPGRGYALGKEARIVISVPDSVSLGTTGEITITGEAAWLGQGGSAAIKQARDFDFSVTVVSESTEYTETIVGQDGNADSEGTPAASEEGTDGSLLKSWLPVIIAGAVVILGAIIIPLLVRRRG